MKNPHADRNNSETPIIHQTQANLFVFMYSEFEALKFDSNGADWLNDLFCKVSLLISYFTTLLLLMVTSKSFPSLMKLRVVSDIFVFLPYDFLHHQLK